MLSRRWTNWWRGLPFLCAGDRAMNSKRKSPPRIAEPALVLGPQGGLAPTRNAEFCRAGFLTADYRDKPVIAILSTWSDLIPATRISRSG